MPPEPIDVTYVLPVRWTDDTGLTELAGYVHEVSATVAEVIVVDGSPEPLYSEHAAALEGVARHVAPRDRTPMGKVGGVITGVLAASAPKVVIADDDVRYDAPALRRMAALLDSAELVRPQNYFDPLPWHARVDAARSLLNRVHSGDRELGSGDFPGTLGVRREAFVACGGYDGDVIFENLELMRTIEAAGGRVATPLDLYVRRLPPTTAHFISQRVRQAYDDFALPVRMAVFLSVLPLLAAAILTRRKKAIGVAALAGAGLAEVGRRRAGGRAYFPFSSALAAPAWILERGVSAWLAVWQRLVHGGVRYGDGLLTRSATSSRELRRRFESDDLVGPVAERVKAGTPATADRDGSPA